jgi:hypothetical protein
MAFEKWPLNTWTAIAGIVNIRARKRFAINP